MIVQVTNQHHSGIFEFLLFFLQPNIIGRFNIIETVALFLIRRKTVSKTVCYTNKLYESYNSPSVSEIVNQY